MVGDYMDDEIVILTDEELENAFTDDAFKMYMREIRRYPNLSVEQQKNLGRRYKEKGDLEAKELLINCNLRLVVSVALNYKPRLKHLQVLDVIQEGNFGLIRAVETYNPEQGAFTTYAVPWINQRIKRALANKDDDIRKPVHIVEAIPKYLRLVESYKQKGIPLPSDEEICKIIFITKGTLKSIRESLKQNLVSLNQTVDDDEKSELEDFIPAENHEYDNVLNRIVNDNLLLVLKEVLNPLRYFVIYHRILSDEPKTLEEVASYLNITRERVRQIEKVTLNKVKPYVGENSYNFIKVLNKIKQRAGCRFKSLKKTPISPSHIIKYMYLKDDLIDIERKLYELYLLGKYNYSYDEYASILGITLQELKQIFANLKAKISKKFVDRKAFKNFKEQMIKTYGTKIFDIDIDKKEKIIDYHALDKKYSLLSLEEILTCFKDVNYTLTPDEEHLLIRYFGNNDKSYVGAFDIEKEVNILKFGFKRKNKYVPLKKLYEEFLRTRDDYTEEQQLYLETYFFGKIDRKLFREVYPNSNLYTDNQKLISRLERSYYHIFEYFENNFTKEAWLKVKAKYWDRFSDDKIEMMDLYFGVKGEPLSRKEIAKKFNMPRVEFNQLFEPTIMYAARLYSGLGRNIDIDKKIYIPYVENPQYSFVPETRQILRQYLIEDKTYEEISKSTGLKTTRISNIITAAIRKIDFFRFGISTSLVIDEIELNDFFSYVKDKVTEEEKEIIKLRYLKNMETKEIVEITGIEASKVNLAVSRFNKMIYSYRIRDVILTEKDLIEEINRHISESVLSLREKQFVSFRYGIKNEYNENGEVLSREKIIEQLGMTKVSFNNTDRVVKYALKGRKIGINKPDILFIPRDELDVLLDDVHLPISDKEKEIICHLFELKGYEYMTLDDLALKYNENKGSVGVRYHRAIATIYKYLNKEIDGNIHYESDILPILKYFSLTDRMKIEDFFKNGMTFEEMAKKYGMTSAQIVGTMNRIRINIYDLNTNPYAKKFDFDYYLEAIQNPDLPFYGDLSLAIKVFNLSFGMNGKERMGAPEIIKTLGLDYDPSTINSMNSILMLSVCKLKDGITKQKTFGYDEIRSYYESNFDNIPQYYRSYYDKYFRNVQNRRIINGEKAPVSYFIIADLILATYPNAFKVSTATRDEVIDIIRKYGKDLKKRIKKALMSRFDIREREFMNGKDINHVFKMLYTLDTKRKEADFKTLSLKN